jgi:hypothetical protein
MSASKCCTKSDYQNTVENIMIIYLNGSNFLPPISQCLLLPARCWCHATPPTNFPWIHVHMIYTAVLPIISSNILDLILFGSNKGYSSCSPCHHFHNSYTYITSQNNGNAKPDYFLRAFYCESYENQPLVVTIWIFTHGIPKYVLMYIIAIYLFILI